MLGFRMFLSLVQYIIESIAGKMLFSPFSVIERFPRDECKEAQSFYGAKLIG